MCWYTHSSTNEAPVLALCTFLAEVQNRAFYSTLHMYMYSACVDGFRTLVAYATHIYLYQASLPPHFISTPYQPSRTSLSPSPSLTSPSLPPFLPGRINILLSDLPNGLETDKWHQLLTKGSRTSQGSIRLVTNFKVCYMYVCACFPIC